jgi:signal recognition particle GTPase
MTSFATLTTLAVQQRAMHDAMLSNEEEKKRDELCADIEKALIARTLPNRAVVYIDENVPKPVYTELITNKELMKELMLWVTCLKCKKDTKCVKSETKNPATRLCVACH